jgi:hypothetical protein
MQKKTILLLLITLLVCSVLVAGYKMFLFMYTLHCLSATGSDIKYHIIGQCIIETKHFPENEQELIQKKFLRKDKTPEGYVYFSRSAFFDPNYPEKENGWNKVDAVAFDMFKIAYGTRPDNMVCKEGKLYDRLSGKQILIIEGPHKGFLQKMYESISVYWFNLLSQTKSEYR